MQELVKQDHPTKAMAGACLMWISTRSDLDANKFQHQKMLEFCGQVFSTMKAQTASQG